MRTRSVFELLLLYWALLLALAARAFFYTTAYTHTHTHTHLVPYSQSSFDP